MSAVASGGGASQSTGQLGDGDVHGDADGEEWGWLAVGIGTSRGIPMALRMTSG